MYKFSPKYIIGAIISCYVLLIPQDAFAAQIKFVVVPNTTVGDKATVVEVHVDPDSKNLNVIEGVVALEGGVSEKVSVAIETGGSVLTLWPTPPTYTPDTKKLVFTGGVPKGFTSEGLLLRLRIFSTIPGDMTLSWAEGRAYVNDGRGTEEVVSARPLTLSLDGQDAAGSVSSDSTPPYFEYTEIARDPSVYEGKYFVSFNALDDISGVAKYEITEGEIVTVHTGGVYILKDQSRNTPITITAYDQAGNTKTITVNPRRSKGYLLLGVSIAVLVLAVLLRYRYTKR